ncbi:MULTISPECIES: hypothetical protein [unclassified Rhodococcus (in: high G+C Gram-positive bacteria)]|uniref:Uncharacterized protein n=1 Tax=Rhodococcus navarretei TaxID=3128981 RepID=A0ABU9D1L7_9NOCA|nr:MULTISPECIES: hypothetical protein [unclassified Rhodococcus (in: high G+C Gram-positive bacteria)]MCJ0890882.1 hypothetical protein [Rhodococcus sp. ARC_M5]MCJ0980661.1 hypothetical protein [Rhodococcus sp. ARC_M12]MDV8020227.1 hypothetical protein [Rhodococcus sp. IEGM 1330]MDZ7932046.1 hypothetical protein [Rhodococcus sp. (in: high G+C Gram-positive bacteria)]
MASLTQKLTSFARSPQGKKMIDQARRYATKPENQAKLKQLGSKFTSRGGRS